MSCFGIYEIWNRFNRSFEVLIWEIYVTKLTMLFCFRFAGRHVLCLCYWFSRKTQYCTVSWLNFANLLVSTCLKSTQISANSPVFKIKFLQIFRLSLFTIYMRGRSSHAGTRFEVRVFGEQWFRCVFVAIVLLCRAVMIKRALKFSVKCFWRFDVIYVASKVETIAVVLGDLLACIFCPFEEWSIFQDGGQCPLNIIVIICFLPDELAQKYYIHSLLWFDFY